MFVNYLKTEFTVNRVCDCLKGFMNISAMKNAWVNILYLSMGTINIPQFLLKIRQQRNFLVQTEVGLVNKLWLKRNFLVH